jgi:large subunit ribosomal protein L24
MHIKVNDTVMVVAGDDKMRQGRVVSIDRDVGKVLVEGMNLVYKHVRRSQRNPQGGRLSLEMPIQLANVMLICQACGRPSRTGARYLADGSKERYCKRCGKSNGELAPARERYAKKE